MQSERPEDNVYVFVVFCRYVFSFFINVRISPTLAHTVVVVFFGPFADAIFPLYISSCRWTQALMCGWGYQLVVSVTCQHH